jgi:uncharacterized protein YbjT (DUF2867 family)
MQPLKVLITGTTGMVGEGVLHVCLQNPKVEKVVVINRKTLGWSHPKMTEIIHSDFYNLKSIESQLTDLDACFFCLGVSSVGMDADTYYRVTYTLTMHVAETLSRLNQDMTFTYVSGMGTKSSREGGKHWSLVKGKTEYDLSQLPFKQVFAYRPGFIRPIKGLQHTHPYYRYINWTFPIGRLLYANAFSTMEEVALSMIEVSQNGCEYAVLNGKEIRETALKAR